MVLLTLAGCAGLVGVTELLARLKRARALDDRISVLERLMKTNVEFNRATFHRFKDRKAEAEKYFKTYDDIVCTYRPYIGRRRLPNIRSAGINTNNLGYRGANFPIEKPAGTFRILLYGGSFVWGTGALTDAETMPAHLEKLLNAGSGKTRFEVINCGETGFLSTQEMIFLAIEGVMLSPDLVVFVDGINEAQDPYGGLPAGYPADFTMINGLVSQANADRFKGQYTPSTELEYLKRQREIVWQPTHLALLQDLGSIASGLTLASTITPEEYALRHLYNLRNCRAIAKEYGSKVAFVLQPTLVFGKPMHASEKAVIDSLLAMNAEAGALRWKISNLEKYGDLVVQGAAKAGTNVIDLRRMFEKDDSPRFFDSCHLSGDGYAIVAKVLHQRLKDAGLLPAGS